MQLLIAKEIFEKVNFFVDLVNNTIGILTARINVEEEYTMSIEIEKKINNDISDFLIKTFKKYIIQENDIYTISEDINGEKYLLIIDYYLDKDALEINSRIINSLIKNLYLTVDEAKVEFGLDIDKDDSHRIPNEIYWQLDEWNEGWIQDNESEKCINEDELRTYKIPINCLYGLTLGYYDINTNDLETDIIPELIGILLDTTEDFCYATAYEDKNYIYIYTVKDLDADNVFDIEEGLFRILPLISEQEQDITLEEAFSNINKEEK